MWINPYKGAIASVPSLPALIPCQGDPLQCSALTGRTKVPGRSLGRRGRRK